MSFSRQSGPGGPGGEKPPPFKFGTAARRPPSNSPPRFRQPASPLGSPPTTPSGDGVLGQPQQSPPQLEFQLDSNSGAAQSSRPTGRPQSRLSGGGGLGQPQILPRLAFQSGSNSGAAQSSRPAGGPQSSPQFRPSWNGAPKPLLKNNDTQRSSFVISRNSGNSVIANISRRQDTQGNRFPPLRDVNARNPTQKSVPRSNVVPSRTQSPTSTSYNYQPVEDFNRVGGNDVLLLSHLVSSGTRPPPSSPSYYNPIEDLDHFGGVDSNLVTPPTGSPPSSSSNHHPVENFGRSGGVIGHAFSSSEPNTLRKSIGDHAQLQVYQQPSRPSPYVSSVDSLRRSPVNYDDVQVVQTRPSINATSSEVLIRRGPRVQQESLQSAKNTYSETTGNNLTTIHISKRTRSPILRPENQVDTEGDTQLKAKRLARFSVGSSKSPQNGNDMVEQRISVSRNEQSNVERNRPDADSSTQLASDVTDGNTVSKFQGVETSGIIIGVCPDMCPDTERAERERKGDLDQHERVGRERNQTSISLAVKKYTRTAERDANLIRPMPILQKTMDYLLSLLDKPYDDKFLSLYNFLWDRMRAIRMDLRMQHIFDQEAISMLEQMIRLHIIAMHELCEYSRGEGFAEGFDAHLNIEQMNKTSVELFQLYDDHRKKGINIPTEKEFRGYYALLKLDKHPGYMVEPAELSLDLAKMTPEIRQTSEVLFARDVARACRTGNFIAFFRLARKATYLQACLMHAHFAKLRTLALASLQAGIQSNQGLPIADVAKWLVMEEEEIESLSEYHGFQLKSYNQEPYIVKEGPLLNGEEEYATKCSELVDMKKSERIIKDVLASGEVASLSAEASNKTHLNKSNTLKESVPYIEGRSLFQDVLSTPRVKSISELDEEMPNCKVVSSPRDISPRQKRIPTSMFSPDVNVSQKQLMIQTSIPSSPKDSRQNQQVINIPFSGLPHGNGNQMVSMSPSPWVFSSYKPQPDKVGVNDKANTDAFYSNSPVKTMHVGTEPVQFQIMLKPSLQSPVNTDSHEMEHRLGQIVSHNLDNEEPMDLPQDNENGEDMRNYQEEEIAEAKLKLIFRLWRRRSVKLRELREKKQIIANAALNSLSVGPPIQLKRDQHCMPGDFDIDQILMKRHQRQGLSWSSLNVSDAIADTLSTRNPDARCLCWKIVVYAQMNIMEADELWQKNHSHEAAPWLLSKLIPSKHDNDDLLVSSPGMSIWKKLVEDESVSDLTCCLSVVKNADSDNLTECVSGTSALLFLVSESIPWKCQKLQLDNLLVSLPCGSCLPLLILAGSFKNVSDPSSVIADNLGLGDLDMSRISSVRIVSLLENQRSQQLDGFYSDNRLREGLRWLASESPPQPILHHVKTHESILIHLNSSLEELEKMKDYEVGPNNCILAFNEALDQSQKEITAAAHANPAGLPCPEIALLEGFSEEHRLVNQCLPSVGWSSAAKLEPLISALGDCRLPTFPNSVSWLPRCSNARKEIESLSVELENGLIGYLADSKTLRLELAINEAHIMLQRSCRLECRDSWCYIVPNWVMIFRRIFNWRLMNLTNGTYSSAYILECPHLDATFRNLGKLKLEDRELSMYHFNQLTLDEVIEVCGTPRMSPRDAPLYETPSTYDLMDSEAWLTDDMENVPDVNRGLENGGGEVMEAGKESKEDDRLNILLRQCNMLQDRIDSKLSFYF